MDAVADAEPGELISGRGWHQEKWDRVPPGNIDGLPTHHTLSAVSPDNPVVLEHASGHAVFANAKAMELAGITSETPDPDGGEIVHDADGNPIGAFRERAQGLLGAAYEYASPSDPRRQVEADTRSAIVEMIWAASVGDLDAVRQIAACGISLNSSDYDGRAPLHLAAAEGQLEIVAFLLQSGANRKCVDRWGQTPLDEAKNNNHPSVAGLLSDEQENQEEPRRVSCVDRSAA